MIAGTGTVSFYNKKKKLGMIHDDKDVVYFFVKEDISGEVPKEGDTVSFIAHVLSKEEAKRGDYRQRARNVKVFKQ